MTIECRFCVVISINFLACRWHRAAIKLVPNGRVDVVVTSRSYRTQNLWMPSASMPAIAAAIHCLGSGRAGAQNRADLVWITHLSQAFPCIGDGNDWRSVRKTEFLNGRRLRITFSNRFPQSNKRQSGAAQLGSLLTSFQLASRRG